MTDNIYNKVAEVLDTLPNGFPKTESGVEIRLLKKVFTPEEAELFCDLRLKFETPEEIAERTGRPLEELKVKLLSMWKRGQVFGIDFGETMVYKMLPWAFGIYEFQLNRMDREFAEMCHEYMHTFGPQFFKAKPQLLQVVPIEKEIPDNQVAMPYEQISKIIENGQSFAVAQCICKKEMTLLEKGCDKPQEVCMGIAPVPGVFENYHWGRPITKEEAYNVLKISEEAGLVHMTGNYSEGHFFICNCCGCCCGVLQSMKMNAAYDGTNSHYYAEINPGECISCGVCADERCQLDAIEEGDENYRIIRERCIGCGVCITTCPQEAIRLIRKSDQEWTPPPRDEKEWFEERGRQRGVDFSQYK